MSEYLTEIEAFRKSHSKARSDHLRQVTPAAFWDDFDAPAAGEMLRPQVIDGVLNLHLTTHIGGWFGVTAEDFLAALQDYENMPLRVFVNSRGGDVFEGVAISAILARHKPEVEVMIGGLCASAATFLLTSANRRCIDPGGMVMIHQASALAYGNDKTLRAAAEMLGKIDSSIVQRYEALTEKSEEQIRAWMEAEYWMTAREAVEHGFADVIETVKIEEPAEDKEDPEEDKEDPGAGDEPEPEPMDNAADTHRLHLLAQMLELESAA